MFFIGLMLFGCLLCCCGGWLLSYSSSVVRDDTVVAVPVLDGGRCMNSGA